MNPKPYSLSIHAADHKNGFTGIIGTATVNVGVNTRIGIGPLKRNKTWKIPTINPHQSLAFVSKQIEKEADKWFESIKEVTNELAPDQKA